MGKYNYIDDQSFWLRLGARIKKEREQAGLSQSQLMEKIGRSAASYRVLGRWEKGISRPEFSDMIELRDVFDCELGYLLCEYDCKTREATDIQEVTGLSEVAISKLAETKDFRKSFAVDICSKLIENKDFWSNISVAIDFLSDYKLADPPYYNSTPYMKIGLREECRIGLSNFIDALVAEVKKGGIENGKH